MSPRATCGPAPFMKKLFGTPKARPASTMASLFCATFATPSDPQPRLGDRPSTHLGDLSRKPVQGNGFSGSGRNVPELVQDEPGDGGVIGILGCGDPQIRQIV